MLKTSSHEREVQDLFLLHKGGQWNITVVLLISYKRADCINGDVSAPMRVGCGRSVGTVLAGLP